MSPFTPDPNLVVEALEYIIDTLRPQGYNETLAGLERALPHAEAIAEELAQSAYYRECRDKWREQAESLASKQPAIQELIAAAREMTEVKGYGFFAVPKARLRTALKAFETEAVSS